jgi:YidC/Oxa1 family membrane protein insertase
MNILYSIIIYPIVQIIEFVFVFAQKIFKETGLSVIAISAAISVLTLPLYAVAETWQRLERDTQKRLKPKLDKIKSVFSGDEQYMILSTYYRQTRYHPIYALRSTFGLLIQIPFFIAAYSYLSSLEALKGASFLFIHDLGTPDHLANIGSFTVNVLPIVMTVLNIIAGAIYTKGFPLKEKVQLYGMAAVFLVLLYNSPAGLVLYWTLNNVFSLLKNLYYAIKLKWKNTIIGIGLSAFCVFIIYYMLVVHKGNSDLRILISVLCALLACTPWIFPFIKKAISNFPYLAYTKKDLFPLFICSALTFWVLTGLVTPSFLIVSSPQEFSFLDKHTTPLFFLGNILL